MPSQSDYTAAVVREVGDPNTTIAPVINQIWALWSDYGAVANGRLQYLYTKRSALEQREAEEFANTDLNVEGEISDAQSQRFNHIAQMKQAVQTEINRMSQVARGSGLGASASGAITAVTPESPINPNSIDPNSGIYRGDPFARLNDRGW